MASARSMALLLALPLAATAREMDLTIPIAQRPQFLDDAEKKPTPVYVTLSVLYVGDIDEQRSTFSLDAFVDVAWRDDRFGENSPQAFGCTAPTVGVGLLVESYAPSICPDVCDGGFCDGAATPAPWSPFLEVTNVAPGETESALVYPTAYVNAGAPARLKLRNPEGVWATASARFSGPILKTYPLENFPYDEQRLEVFFESNAWTNDDVVLVPTYDPIEIKNNIIRSDSMLGWDVVNVSVASRPNYYSQLDVTYDQTVLTIVVRRQSSPYSLRYTMVEFFIMAMMVLSSIHASASVRIGNAVAGFASTLYLQFILAQSTPPLNYLTRLDKFFMVSLIITFICAVLGGAHAWREVVEKAVKDAEEAEAKKKDAEGGAALSVREVKPPSKTLVQIFLSRQNPFSGDSKADLLTYFVIFAVYSIAAACVLLV